MKRYKAIFDLPDDVTPPSVIGFQVVVNGTLLQNCVAPLMPMGPCDVEDGEYKEVKDD